MSDFSVGSIVRCRNREWVVLPSSTDEIMLLRPLTGTEEETCGISTKLANLCLDRPESASFPLPGPEDVSDAVGAELLWNAARLCLRDGAGPFRSLGRLSIRPRPYQFVPLMMALRLQPVRMLVADDVGVGKTIEALLIARELLDRGEIQRICILCPPYLCDQWKRELWEKFNVEAVVIRSGSVAHLEREVPADRSVFGHYPYMIVSIDYAKSERHRPNFLLHCPELVIVDEAHGAAQSASSARGQQQRHELLKRVAEKPDQHLILLTATPHGGLEEPFLSLLGLLQPQFGRTEFNRMAEKERDALARHFVQRRRADVVRWMGEETPFPERIPQEVTYSLSGRYNDLFNQVYKFSRDLVKTGESLTGWKRRIRFWTALALLRCVMSSPAAAEAALEKRGGSVALEEEPGDEAYSPYIYEPTDDDVTDAQPAHIVEEAEAGLAEGDRRHLRRFAALARELRGSAEDNKLTKCREAVRELLRDGCRPIVWCRYIATSDYVAEELQRRLSPEFSDLRVISVTGSIPEDDREARVKELAGFKQRVLVATDCLSEGMNLQASFDAVVHYDLPWNPNRLEQREGRVDRFGQTAKKVKAVLLYGQNNPVDGAVLDVLLRKAKEIHRSLGITVPVPVDSETVMEAVLRGLFSREPLQPMLPLFEEPIVQDVRRKWDEAARREQESRTKFAQRAISPEEVARELEESDSVLGDPEAVKGFVVNALARFNVTVPARDGVLTLSSLGQLPETVQPAVPDKAQWRVTFVSPAPERVAYLGRNHPFVAELAQYLLEESLTRGKEAHATRCGAIRTNGVERRTAILLLRLRYMLQEPKRSPMLAEEVYVCGVRGSPPDRLDWLPDGEALDLLKTASVIGNISIQERREVLQEALGWWDGLQPGLEGLIRERSRRLGDAHRRVRKAADLAVRGTGVRPYLPPDLLGLLVLLPVPKGVAR